MANVFSFDVKIMNSTLKLYLLLHCEASSYTSLSVPLINICYMTSSVFQPGLVLVLRVTMGWYG